VAAGIARTYGIDVSLVRVLWIIAGVFWIGIPAYVVAWIAIAPGDGDDSDEDHPRDFGLLAALALIGIGVAIALGRWLPDGFHGGLFAHSLQPLPERLLEDLPPKDRQMRHRNRIVRRLPGQRLTKLLELDLHVFDPSVERG
jgi:phage shock protein PspC (stress-responsive transcriptional regulator)